jgi:acetolactate synthase-1/2/3 large subunit
MVDIFLRYLKAERARAVFAIPGGLIHPFCEAVAEDSDLTLVVTKHEEGAAFMADGYARVGRRLAVCAGTSGPGATNLLTGVAVAFADGIPMLVITGQAVSSALGKGAAQETPPEDIDIVSMFRPITKYSTMVMAPERFSHHLRRALRLALTGRPGPVHLNVPVDLWGREANESWFEPTTYRPNTSYFDRDSVRRAAEALVTAKRPLLLAGSGVAAADAQSHLINLVELIDALVVTTPRAKGVFPEDHPASRGVLGFAGHRSARETLMRREPDVLMTVGASLNETTTFNWNPAFREPETLIHLDIEPDRIGRNYPVDIPLVGDAQTILVELIYHIHRQIREHRSPQSRWERTASEDSKGIRFDDQLLREQTTKPLTPQRWRAELDAVLPEDAIVFSDIGGHMLFNIHHLTIRQEQRFILNLGFGSMGHGTAAPIGAAVAHPSRPVLAIVGDGCFTMNGMELLTAVEYEVPVIWLVENNQMHGITWHGSRTVSGRPMNAVRYHRHLEIAAIARAMGLVTWTVDGPGQLADILDNALSLRQPALIEIRVDVEIPPPLADRAKTIAGFKGNA